MDVVLYIAVYINESTTVNEIILEIQMKRGNGYGIYCST